MNFEKEFEEALIAFEKYQHKRYFVHKMTAGRERDKLDVEMLQRIEKLK